MSFISLLSLNRDTTADIDAIVEIVKKLVPEKKKATEEKKPAEVDTEDLPKQEL